MNRRIKKKQMKRRLVNLMKLSVNYNKSYRVVSELNDPIMINQYLEDFMILNFRFNHLRNEYNRKFGSFFCVVFYDEHKYRIINNKRDIQRVMDLRQRASEMNRPYIYGTNSGSYDPQPIFRFKGFGG